ncbi:MAG: beta-lactamase family protein [Lentisphaerae bacterium]|nr:beta-lactamase family protein [Lentisphaerota bacterium]
MELDITISNAVDSQFSFATGANSNKPGGIVGVALDGELVFQRAYGMADVAGGVPNSVAAPFYLASCSKQFTAMSVLLCQEMGLLRTADEIRQYIPELHTSFNGVTIQHMLNMISAIYDTGTGNQSQTATGMLAGLLMEGEYGIVAAEKPIGSTLKYCNMNYVLLGIVVERVSGRTLRQFAHDEIFSRLGMTGTDIRDTATMVVTNQPNGYDASLVLWSTASSNSPATGSTGVSSTLADLVTWHENFYVNKLGDANQSLIATMETAGRYTSGTHIGQPASGGGLPSYACGVMPDSYAGNARVWHTGRWMGFKTAMCRYPNLHLSVFILMNRDDQLPSFQTVADAFLNNVRFANNPPPSSAQQGTPYHFRYSATGAPKPVFTLESGAFPDGVFLNTDGTVAGTPVVPGDFAGVTKATSGAKTRTQAFTIHVDPASPLRITASSLGNGAILPAGAIDVPYGASASFTNIPAPWYHIGAVDVDGVMMGTPSVYTFTNVIAGHTIQVRFAADTAISNTPAWWLAEASSAWTNDLNTAASHDQDGDGLFTWQEYIAGTHPTNPASVFALHTTWTGGQWTVRLATVEPGAPYEGVNRYYSFDSRPSMVGAEWEPVPGLTDVRGTGQVLTCSGMDSASNRFYRGRVWLAP